MSSGLNRAWLCSQQKQDDDSDEQTTAAPRIISRHRMAEEEEEEEVPPDEEEEDDELREARRAAVRERCSTPKHDLAETSVACFHLSAGAPGSQPRLAWISSLQLQCWLSMVPCAVSWRKGSSAVSVHSCQTAGMISAAVCRLRRHQQEEEQLAPAEDEEDEEEGESEYETDSEEEGFGRALLKPVFVPKVKPLAACSSLASPRE